MTIETALVKFDRAFAPFPVEPPAPAPAAPVKPRGRALGRRFLVTAAASGAAVLGFAGVTQATGVHAAALPIAGTDGVRRMPTLTQPELAGQMSNHSGADARQAPAEPVPEMASTPAPSAAELRDWSVFRSRFVQADGRVVDTYNNDVSHTESQGLGMLFAVAFDDRETFDRIWGWTSAHLRRPSDALFAWRYVPGQINPVADTNNATDGDIYIAAALARAAGRWRQPAHLKAAQAISRDILGLLVRNVGGRTVLLPGANGFVTADHVVVNASYYVFPLIADLQRAYPSPTWARLARDGRQMIAEAQFGRWRLPPDWLQVSTATGALSLADRQPPRFSFDAVRVPLFLAWDRSSPDALGRFAAFWGREPANAPAWVDLRTDAGAPYKPCGGVIAIATLVDSTFGQAGAVPAISARDDYYSAALILLSRMALRETGLLRA
jgi:endoglucanase